MSKTLVTIKPFFVMEEGDTFQLTGDGKYYKSEYNEEYCKSDDNNSEIETSYKSEYCISLDYAKTLIEGGYLKEPYDDKCNKNYSYVNVFTEIDNLLDRYNIELENIDEDYADAPECIKVEATTVLNNLVKTLTHLKSLKK